MTKIKNYINKFQKNQQGFTLVELLLYMGLSVILLVIVSGVFISILSVRNESVKNSSIEREGRYILNRLSRDVYISQDILEPVDIGESSDTLQLLIDSELITYRIVNERLYLIDDTNSYLMSGESVKVIDFNVEKLGNNGGKSVVEITLTAESENVSDGIIQTRDYKTILSVR